MTREIDSLFELVRVSGSGANYEHYARDWSLRKAPPPVAVVFPESLSELQAVVHWAYQRRVALVPSGGRSGLSGGAIAVSGEVVVSMERMRATLEFNSVDRTLSVQAGVTTQQIQETAKQHGLFYPVDFASRGTSQIGGNIATNAGGIKVLRYGLTRAWVAGLTVVTGAGEVLELNRGLAKNATGYDLRHLFIGSEGTLGIVAEATLQLTSPPAPQQVMVLSVPRLGALMQVFAELRSRLELSAFEFFSDSALRHVLASGGRCPLAARAPYYLLAEFDENEAAACAMFESLATAGLVVDGVIGTTLAQNEDLWRLREGITESISKYNPYKNDIAVRVSRIPGFLERMETLFAREYPSFDVVWFGHLGDGNLHISILRPDSMDTEAFQFECDRVTGLLGIVLKEFAGSVSAEHGVGLWKKPYLHYTRSEGEIRLMSQLKQVFDPHSIMNPGKLID